MVEESQAAYTRYRGMDGRVAFILLDNPDDTILHTVLVEKNGLIHALTFATPHEDRAGMFHGTIAYEKWIQPD